MNNIKNIDVETDYSFLLSVSKAKLEELAGGLQKMDLIYWKNNKI